MRLFCRIFSKCAKIPILALQGKIVDLLCWTLLISISSIQVHPNELPLSRPTHESGPKCDLCSANKTNCIYTFISKRVASTPTLSPSTYVSGSGATHL